MFQAPPTFQAPPSVRLAMPTCSCRPQQPLKIRKWRARRRDSVVLRPLPAAPHPPICQQADEWEQDKHHGIGEDRSPGMPGPACHPADYRPPSTALEGGGSPAVPVALAGGPPNEGPPNNGPLAEVCARNSSRTSQAADGASSSFMSNRTPQGRTRPNRVRVDGPAVWLNSIAGVAVKGGQNATWAVAVRCLAANDAVIAPRTRTSPVGARV